MKNIHVLTTGKPSRLLRGIEGIRLFEEEVSPDNGWCVNVNICITSDEEIKEGDPRINNYQRKLKGEEIPSKKIILTTNKLLIKDGVQSIDDEFLEWFVKNPSCEEVEVVKTAPIRPFGSLYKIIIPKEEAKKKHIVMIVGDKVNEEQTKCYCGHTTYCDCGPEESKQETLEEFIEKEGYPKGVTQEIWEQGVRDGAKWQQERSYSEEDMAESFMACWKANVPEGFECKLSFKEWFEQFKNK